MVSDKTKKILAWAGVGLAVLSLLHVLGVIDADTFNALKTVFGQ